MKTCFSFLKKQLPSYARCCHLASFTVRHLIALHSYKELFEWWEHPPPRHYSTVSPTQAASCLLIAVIVTQGEHWETTQLCCSCCLRQRKTNLACFLMVSLITSASKQFLTLVLALSVGFLVTHLPKLTPIEGTGGDLTHGGCLPVQDWTSHHGCFKSGTFTFFLLFPTYE